MEEEAGDDMAAYSDETVGLVKTLLRVQNNIVHIPGGEEHFDMYLAKEIYPALVPGLEELSREIDRLQNSEEGEIDDSIKARFNPCIFLAEYLMRNNAKHGTKLEYSDTFIKYARVEKIRRFFSHKKQKIYKHFCIQAYQANFSKQYVKEYLTALDGFLAMEGKLEKQFGASTFFTKFYNPLTDDDLVQFEDFYEILSKWAISPDQLDLSHDDFAVGEEKANAPAGFKK